MNRKNFLLSTGIIALYFLWGGSAYISQMYRLHAFLSPEQVDIIAMRWNYIAQALGIILFSLFLWYAPSLASKPSTYAIGMFINAIVITVMLTWNNLFIIVFSGVIMNLFLGIFAAYQFAVLATQVPQQMRGRAFGFAYAIGSIGTYLISLMLNGRMMESGYVVLLYIGFILINMKLISAVQNLPISEENKRITLESFPSKSLLLQFIAVFLLMSLINSIGSNYQSSTIFHKKINFELARAFYALGLVIAGIIADKSRKYGALCCLASLFFPFAAIVLYKEPSFIFITWAFSYLLLGFYSVYRVIAFVDISSKKTEWLPLAGLGLCVGRVGEALSTFIPSALLHSSIFSTILIAALFMPLIILFIILFQRLYMTSLSIPKTQEDFYKEFENEYSLTNREREILRYVIKGYSNSEISSLAYISENTVKFHIKNILKKTNCSNRTEIMELLQKMELSTNDFMY
ncbi:regulatory protein, luxR family [Proteiniborus ethanoligenes]|uniref:Regulatory protein, luxR family n=1 Tax=Proteiniborus ethanoligenes TaxID=415015 RepID=A0A1H3KUH9_9FIRM|nr:LuxR family transcriptional regulator [Proteiniborus ethanoligenes]SDY55418.1 regulatory protein, luxR family [Proteiniborus ethanoligenes]